MLVLIGCALAGGVLRAQDRLVFKDRHVEEGKIAGMSNGAVVINVAAGQVSYNLGLLARVEAAPPPAFQTGSAAYEAGDWDKALTALKPVADQFKGLPTEWASQALAALGDIYIEKNELPQAVATFNEYRALYPKGATGSLRMNLAQARVAFAQNDFAAAEKQLLPLRDAALKNPAQATRAEGAVYGQTCYLLGRLEEQQGSYQAALVDYLLTVTLFYEDGAVTTRAEKSADALRAAHPGISAP
jgi:predicted Zn-dependent protease